MPDQHYAIVDKATGVAVSFGTSTAPAAELAQRGLEVLAIPAPPLAGEQWDPKARRVIPTGAPDVRPDPASVLDNDPDYVGMTPAQKAQTRAIVRALGG